MKYYFDKSIYNKLHESVDTVKDNYILKIYDPSILEDKQYIRDNKDIIFNFLNDGYKYAKLGNYCGCTSAKSLAKNINKIKIAYLDNIIIAISIYTGYQGGYKCVGITATTNMQYRKIGVIAVKDIIREDTQLYKDFYWCECSDTLEYLYKKYNGIPIPNEYIEYFIGNKFETKKDDGYHFTVNYKVYDPETNNNLYKPIDKIIYGFNSKETYDKIISDINSSIYRQIKFINNNVSESSPIGLKRDNYQAAHDIIYVFYNELCNGINEFTEDLIKILKDSINLLEKYNKENSDNNRYDKFDTAIYNGNDILSSIDILKLHKF